MRLSRLLLLPLWVQLALAASACAPAGMSPVPTPAGPGRVAVPSVAPAPPAALAPAAASAGFTVAGIADYRGKPMAGAPIGIYKLGDGTLVGSSRTGADGAFALAVTGARVGDLLEIVAYDGGHVLATVAFPRAPAYADGRRYGRVPLTFHTTIITGAFADSLHTVGALVARRDPAAPTAALARAQGIFDAFVAKRDAGLLSLLAAEEARPWPAAGASTGLLPSYVDALRDNVSSIKTAINVPVASGYQLTAAGDRSSTDDLTNMYSYCDFTYMGESHDALTRSGFDTDRPDDLPPLSDTQLAAIETAIQLAKGPEAEAAGDTGNVVFSVVTFFKDLASDAAALDGLADAPAAGSQAPSEPEPSAKPAPARAPQASAGAGGHGSNGAEEPDPADVTASGPVRVRDGILADPPTPIRLGK